VLSLLDSPHNLHAYEEASIRYEHVPLGRREDWVVQLRLTYALLSTWLAEPEERVLVRTFAESMQMGVPTPIPRMRYEDALERFGIDKPDLRFGMELRCIGEWASTCDFQVFRGALESGGRVMGLTVEGGAQLSRKDIEALEQSAKECGAKGLAWC